MVVPPNDKQPNARNRMPHEGRDESLPPGLDTRKVWLRFLGGPWDGTEIGFEKARAIPARLWVIRRTKRLLKPEWLSRFLVFAGQLPSQVESDADLVPAVPIFPGKSTADLYWGPYLLDTQDEAGCWIYVWYEFFWFAF